MKKIALILTVLIVTANTCFSNDNAMQKRVMEVGYRILNANGIEKRITFYYSPEMSTDSSAESMNKKVVVNKGLIQYVEEDDELAAILSHEIAHIEKYHQSFWNRPKAVWKKNEMNADTRGVDFMVNAGYNPVAMIVFLSKTTGESSVSKRLANIYEYIFNEYPAYLVENDYIRNVYYQNFLVTSKEARERVRKNYEAKMSN